MEFLLDTWFEVQNSRGQVSKYLQGVIQKNFCWVASSSGKVPFVSPMVEGSPAKSASVIALMLSRSLNSVSTAQADKVVHMFVVCFTLEYHHSWGQAPPSNPLMTGYLDLS